MISIGPAVLCTPRGSLPMYGRLLPEPCAAGVVRIRLTADHPRARKGERLYVLAKNTALYRRGRHASGVRIWGPRWPWIMLGYLAKAK